jgi:hypothetical protein
MTVTAASAGEDAKRGELNDTRLITSLLRSDLWEGTTIQSAGVRGGHAASFRIPRV